MLYIQGSPRHYIEDEILVKWRSDPWGCNDLRNVPMMDKILLYAAGLDQHGKLELFSKLGEPDKIIYHRGQKRSIYCIGSTCIDGKAIPDTQDSDLEVTQDSLIIYFSFEHY